MARRARQRRRGNSNSMGQVAYVRASPEADPRTPTVRASGLPLRLPRARHTHIPPHPSTDVCAAPRTRAARRTPKYAVGSARPHRDADVPPFDSWLRRAARARGKPKNRLAAPCRPSRCRALEHRGVGCRTLDSAVACRPSGLFDGLRPVNVQCQPPRCFLVRRLWRLRPDRAAAATLRPSTGRARARWLCVGRRPATVAGAGAVRSVADVREDTAQTLVSAVPTNVQRTDSPKGLRRHRHRLPRRAHAPSPPTSVSAPPVAPSAGPGPARAVRISAENGLSTRLRRPAECPLDVARRTVLLGPAA